MTNSQLTLDMKEQIARAIYEANAGKWRGEGWESAGGNVEHSNTREAYMREALAALSAIEAAGYVVVPREASGKMIDAGAMSFGVGNYIIGPAASLLDGQPSKCWRAMIEAASEGTR